MLSRVTWWPAFNEHCGCSVASARAKSWYLGPWEELRDKPLEGFELGWNLVEGGFIGIQSKALKIIFKAGLKYFKFQYQIHLIKNNSVVPKTPSQKSSIQVALS